LAMLLNQLKCNSTIGQRKAMTSVDYVFFKKYLFGN
jgi:hypothetical protein